MKYVILRNGVADEIHEKFVDGSIQWSGDIGPGWAYVGGMFVVPEPPTPTMVYSACQQQLL